MAIKDLKLNDGNAIPGIGFGTWQIPDGPVCVQAVEWAIEAGYRLIDTAVGYGNEKSVGQAIKESHMPRERLFISTKVQGDTKTYEGAKAEIDASLERLGVSYIDLVLIHCAKPWKEYYGVSYKSYNEENLQVWKALVEAQKAGKVKSIGVSNFGPRALANIVDNSSVVPAVDQIRYFIGLDQGEKATTDYCKAHGIVVEAYSPLNTGEILGNTRIGAIAKKYNVTIPRLALAYCVNKGYIPLPKSTHEQWIRANLDCDLALDPADMAYLDSVKYLGSFRQPD